MSGNLQVRRRTGPCGSQVTTPQVRSLLKPGNQGLHFADVDRSVPAAVVRLGALPALVSRRLSPLVAFAKACASALWRRAIRWYSLPASFVALVRRFIAARASLGATGGVADGLGRVPAKTVTDFRPGEVKHAGTG